MALDVRKTSAIEVLARGGRQAEAARIAGVNRSTVKRWLEDSEFQQALADASDLADAQAQGGLTGLVPKALATIEAALEGNATAAQGGVALNVIKAAMAISKEEAAGETSLEARLAELDSRNPRQSD